MFGPCYVLPWRAASLPTLDITTLENWLWEATCKIRGPVDAPKYKDYILPPVFLKRLSDVFDDEVARWGKGLTDAVLAVSRENPRLAGVIDTVDFNATQAGQRIIGDDRLRELVQVLKQHRLALRPT